MLPRIDSHLTDNLPESSRIIFSSLIDFLTDTTVSEIEKLTVIGTLMFLCLGLVPADGRKTLLKMAEKIVEGVSEEASVAVKTKCDVCGADTYTSSERKDTVIVCNKCNPARR
jgi:hypothetical protein